MSETVDILVPALDGYENVPVVDVYAEAGKSFRKEEPLFSLESDKAIMDIPSEYEGTIVTFTLKIGDTVSEGDKIGTMEIEASGTDDSEKASSGKSDQSHGESDQSTVQVEKTPVKETAVSTDSDSGVDSSSGPLEPSQSANDTGSESSGEFHASPSVRLLARELGVSLGNITATGPKGRIRREDLLAYVKNAVSGQGTGRSSRIPQGFRFTPETFEKEGEIEILTQGNLQKIASTNLSFTWNEVPQVTHFDEADVTDLEAYRKKENIKLKESGNHLTVLPFIIKAVIKVLLQYPSFNSSLLKDSNQLILKKYYNIGFAVDTDNGLQIPVAKDCHTKGLLDLSHELAQLGEKARNNKLTRKDISCGTFTISSLGSIGGTGFTPIIKYPEVAILGVSKAQIKPVWNRETGSFEPRTILPFSLTYDHRVINGADAARFCKYLAELLAELRDILL